MEKQKESIDFLVTAVHIFQKFTKDKLLLPNKQTMNMLFLNQCVTTLTSILYITQGSHPSLNSSQRLEPPLIFTNNETHRISEQKLQNTK